jgi:hypothetical protein
MEEFSMQAIKWIVGSGFFLGVVACLAVVLVLRLLATRAAWKAEIGVGEHVATRLLLLVLLVLVGFLGWAQLTGRPGGRIDAAEAPGVLSPASPKSNESASAPESADTTSAGNASFWTEVRVLRFLLWLNLALALPWITGLLVRAVLKADSNTASFALLTTYTIADIVLGMWVGGLRFAGTSEIALLAGVLVLASAYNYWACETIAGLWVRASKP